MNDSLKLTGKLEITLTKENGKVIKDIIKNLVVTVGKNHIADQLSDNSEATMSHMALGEGTAVAIIGDIALGSEISGSRKAFTNKTQGTGGDANKIVYNCDWSAGEGTGEVSEAGLFNNVSAGTMLARTTFSTKSKGVNDALAIQWTITIS